MPVARNHMSTELLTVDPSAPVTEVAKRMVAKDVGAVLVFEEGAICGILTERDVLRAVADGLDDATLVRDRGWARRFSHRPSFDTHAALARRGVKPVSLRSPAIRTPPGPCSPPIAPLSG